MAIPTYPGVYVEEIPSGVRPITAASTSTPAFIGEAEKGSLTEAVKIYNFTQFQNLYGGFLDYSYLAYAVYQFFNNGGAQCYVLRVAGDNVGTASINLSDRAATPQLSLTINAVSPGFWGNGVEVVISDSTRDPGNEFKLTVFYEGETTLRESYDNLSMVAGVPNFVETATRNSNFIQVKVNQSNQNVTAGTSRGADAPKLPLPADSRRLRININNDGYEEIDLQNAVGSGAGQVADLKTPENVCAAIQFVVRSSTPQHSTTPAAAFSNFTCTLDAGVLLLTAGAVGAASSVNVAPAANSAQDATGFLNLGRLYGGVETLGGAVTRPIANDVATAAGTSRGATAPTVPLPDGKRRLLRININSDGFQEVSLDDAVGSGAGQVADLKTPQNVCTAIQFAVRRLTRQLTTTDARAYTNFTCTLDAGGVLLLTSGTKGTASVVTVEPPTDVNQDATEALHLGQKYSGLETRGRATPRYLVGDQTMPAVGVFQDSSVKGVVKGLDGNPITTSNDQPFIKAFDLLDRINDVSLLAVPGRGSSKLTDAGMNYCATRSLKDCFFIGDMASDDDTPDLLKTFVTGISTKNSYGAVYAPWLLMPDPTGVSKAPKEVPPSGFVAGMYAKTDTQRGVWKAPAGTAAALAGATGLVVNFTDGQQGDLNIDHHVNLIRQFPAAGRIIWGARTITSDAEWRYIPVRRMAIFLRVSIYNGIQWAVFEPNDEPLWSQLRLNIRSFMMTLFRRGAFQGSTPSQAFFVKCDSETTTQDDIDQGIVNVLVGFAPLKPAEFVVVKISQKAGQSS